LAVRSNTSGDFWPRYCKKSNKKYVYNKQEAIIMSEYKLKPGKLGKKIMDAYQGIEDKFVDKFLEEDGSLKTGGMAEKATAAYHKVEDTVVGGYKKVENAFVDAFLEKVDEPESKDFEEKK